MTELRNVLETVKQRIDRYGSKGINEQDTKAALVQPVLRALGWDVEDLDDVQREYKIRRQDKPVDYAVFLEGEARLFVEAKALGQNLDDRKWANQIMGYAGVAGVGWVVLTDGNEYRLYNSHAAVPIEKKLFRTVQIATDPINAQEMLSLLSKARMRDNEIDELWKAHFVDRQVQTAIRELFSSTPNPSIVRLISKKAAGLSPKEVKASLRRAVISFDHKATQSMDGKPRRRAKLEHATSKQSRTSKRGVQVKFTTLGFRKSEVIPLLLREGLLTAGMRIVGDYRGHELTASITPDGRIDFRGAVYSSPSAAGAAAKQFVSGKFLATDGWSFWHYVDGGAKVNLSVARQKYLSKQVRQS
jgi:hypothetical protein